MSNNAFGNNLINNAIANNKVLNPQALGEYFKEYSETKSNDIRDIIFNSNLRLVKNLCKNHYGKDYYEDLMQIGSIGLLKSIESFDVSNKYAFSTYATRCINNEINTYFRTLNMKKRSIYDTCSMEEPILNQKSEDMNYHEAICDENVNIEEQAINNALYEQMYKNIKNVLTDKEYEILLYRYGLENKPQMTTGALGKMLGVHHSDIVRSEHKAIRKLNKIYADSRKLYILIGLPNSGKSEYAKYLMDKDDNTVLISTEQMRNDGVDDKIIYNEMMNDAEEHLNFGSNVIIDGCNLDINTRKLLINRLEKQSTKIIGIFLYKNFSECVIDYQKDFIYMYNNIKKFELPSIKEGFDELIVLDNSNNHKTIDNNIESYLKGTLDDFNELLSKCNVKFNIEYATNEKGVDLSLNRHMFQITKRTINTSPLDRNIWIATALHDCGKPIVSSNSKDGVYCTYSMHSRVSSYLSIEATAKMGLELDDILDISSLISLHHNTDIKNSNIRKRLAHIQNAHELNKPKEQEKPLEDNVIRISQHNDINKVKEVDKHEAEDNTIMFKVFDKVKYRKSNAIILNVYDLYDGVYYDIEYDTQRRKNIRIDFVSGNEIHLIK